jgi:hypothetical protein
MYIQSSILNPANLVDKNRELLPNYNFKHFDEWTDLEQQLPHQTKKCYKQKWQFDDIAKFQFKSDFTPIRMQIRNLDTKQVVVSEVNSILATIGSEIYTQNQFAFDDGNFEEGGVYQFEVIGGDPGLITLISDPFQVREEWPDTLLFKYWHDSNQSTYLWEIQDYVTFRCEGVIPFDVPASVRTVYTDQPQDQITVKGDPYRIFDLYVGHEGGFPNWVIDKLEEILDQNNLEIDGKPFAANTGATWTKKFIERYPWAEWNIKLRETVNRRAKRFEVTGLQEKKVVEEFYVEGKLFGPVHGAANDTTYRITQVS